MKHPQIAIVRGKFLNRYEMQAFAPLTRDYSIRAFSSLTPLHDQFAFPLVKLPSPMDLPNFPYKMPLLNRLMIDAHYLVGLEAKLRNTDLVHTAETYFHFTQQCLNAKQRGLVRKVIATVWETIPHNNEGIWGRSSFKKRALRELDHILAVTNKAKAALMTEGADPARISVVGASVDTSVFYPDVSKRAHDKLRLRVLFCGRLEYEKGVVDLLAAARFLAADPALAQSTLDLHIVGNGTLHDTVIREARHLGKIWHSTVESATYDQMPSIYRQADIFVAPSKPTKAWEEQFGMALLEAQASGLPIVTTTSGGIPENVGESAVLVSPGDIRSLSAAIKDFVLHPRKRAVFAQSARARALAIHDIRVGARKIAKVYKQVLST
jgi:glycosyltransferase involved in cell wall biosynthesis